MEIIGWNGEAGLDRRKHKKLWSKSDVWEGESWLWEVQSDSKCESWEIRLETVDTEGQGSNDCYMEEPQARIFYLKKQKQFCEPFFLLLLKC